MFTFVVTYALSKTAYIKRIALLFIHSKLAMKGPWMFITLYFASILVVGSFISPTVLFFVYLPILEEIYVLLELKKGDKLASILMMGNGDYVRYLIGHDTNCTCIPGNCDECIY